MIAGIFHNGSGLGNQLHRYVFARTKAADLGVPFGMIFPENFKGASFMNLDMGKVENLRDEFNEQKVVNDVGNDIRPYDERVKDIKDFTLVDGEFQDERYFEHRLEDIREWLKVQPLYVPDDLCIINFRGGEYVGVPDLFLPKEYWNKAQQQMQIKNPGIRFEVHTDDVETARKFFDWHCIHDIDFNWRSIRYAKHLILSNSSFAILPALLGNAKDIIVPKFWAGYNKGYMQMQQNVYKRFTYIHHED